MYIDTHCHLSFEDYDDIDFVIKENRESGISKIIVSGCTKNTIKESLNIVKKYDEIYLTIGYHPSEADKFDSKDIALLKKQIEDNEKVVGIGEIGLDYHYDKENMELQKKMFRAQLELANNLNLPVVIHSRDAVADTINILKEFPSVKGVIHCFSGSCEVAKEYISMGYFLGIGGIITFKNSNLYRVLSVIGLDNILLETDAPYLTPEPYRGKKNSSKYIPIIAERISDILNISVSEVANKTSINAITLFDLK